MAIVPGELLLAEQQTDETLTPIGPSKTYRLTGTRIGGIIDGQEAIEQFIWKAVTTAYQRYLIYDGQYGCELDNLIGATVTRELVDEEIPRVIREALMYDDRIDSVDGFVVRHEEDKMYISFNVELVTGEVFESEVSV